MQYIARQIKYHPEKPFDPADIIKEVQDTMKFYMYDQEYEIEESLIFLLDNPEFVPSLKSATQRDRDKSDETIFTGECYDNYIKENPEVLNRADRSIIDESNIIKLNRNMIWRSVNLRFQLYRLITNAFLAVPVKEGLTVLLDDGIAIGDADYSKMRETMIRDYNFTGRTEYEKECLVATLSRHFMTERIYSYPDGQAARQEKSYTGEADIKVCRYITRKYKRYLIVSQDTDLIFILLLFMKTLLDPETRTFDEDLEIWLDSRMPSDERTGLSRTYRFINMKLLYLDIIGLFRREYPAIINPIETFIFLVYSRETDFTRALPSSIGMSAACVWNTFSELHCGDKKAGYLIYRDTPITESIKPLARLKSFHLPSKYYNILSSAITVCFNNELGTYDIQIDEKAAQRFFHLICELKIRKELNDIGYTDYADKTGGRYILDVDGLFAKIHLLEEHITQFKQMGRIALEKREEENAHQFSAILSLEKKAVAGVASGLIPLPAMTSTTNTNNRVLDFDSVTTVSINHENLRKLSMREIPPKWGMPTLAGMIARIYRIQFIMNYHQNAGLVSDYALYYDEPHENHHYLSKHGWCTVEIKQTPENIRRGDFNNAYFLFRKEKDFVPGLIPFEIFETHETDHIYHREFNEYFSM